MLLEMLEALVRRDGGPPGFRGAVAIGVIGHPTRWFVAVAGASITTSVTNEMPEAYDVAVLLSAASTSRMLGLHTESAETETRLVTGDEALLKRFVDRYVRQTNAITLRMQAGAP